MKIKARNVIQLLLLLSLFAITFCSCNSGELDNLPSEHIEIWLDANTKELAWLTRVANKFQLREKNGSIKFKTISFEDLKPALMTSSDPAKLPDIVLIPSDWIGELCGKDKLWPLTIDKEAFIAPAINALTHKGLLFAAPWSFETIALIYNKRLVKKPPTNLEELISISADLQKQNIYPLMYDNKNFYFHSCWYFAFGAKLFSEGHVAVNSREAIKSFQFAVDLEKKYNIVPKDANQAATLNLFCANKVGMIIGGPWILSELERNKMQYGIAILPAPAPGYQAKPFVGAKGFALIKKAKTKKYVERFAQFIISEKNQKSAMEALKILPCSKPLYTQKLLPKQLNAFLRQASEGIPMSSTPKMKFMWNELNWSLRQAFTSTKSLKSILDEAAAAIKGNIKKADIQ